MGATIQTTSCESASLRFRQAGLGHEALRILEQHGPIHLLLTDVMMPVMSGPELAKRVKSLAPGTKVIYMSGYTDDTLAFYGLPQPDTQYIQKPFTPAALAGEIASGVIDCALGCELTLDAPGGDASRFG